jgi:hypothetical protein
MCLSKKTPKQRWVQQLVSDDLSSLVIEIIELTQEANKILA